MASAILDLTINEGDTFIMSIEFWETVDMTIPRDLTNSTFKGSFEFSGNIIPMTMEVVGNVLNASVPYQNMRSLPKKGKYDIDELLDGTENYRLVQGSVRVSQEVTV